MPQSAIRAIIFDCFGVIITDGLEAITQRLEKTDAQARAFVGDMIRQNNSGLIKPAETNRRIAEYLGLTVEEWVHLVSVGEVRNADLLDWIKQLRRHYKTAVLSNAGEGSLSRRFTDGELEALFDDIVVSADVGMIKPDPEIYRLAAKRLGVSPADCVFLDDRQVYVQAANSVGMHGVCYQSLQQARADIEQLLSDHT